MAQLFTIKETVTQASMEIGIAQRPVNSVVNTDDQDIVQMVALMSAVADEVMDEEPYKTTLGDGVWCSDKDGTPKIRPTTDTDLILFDGRLAVTGLKYRFKKEKGLEFGEDQRDFLLKLNKKGADINGRVIDLDTDEGRSI